MFNTWRVMDFDIGTAAASLVAAENIDAAEWTDGTISGNNEGQAVQELMNRMPGSSEPLAGALYYDTIMPEALAELDPTASYWPGSPTGGPNGNSMLAGDVHHWTGWHGLPLVPIDVPIGSFDHSPAGVAYARHAEDKARFISEYGIQASPGMQTLRRPLPEGQRTLGSEGLLDRIKDKVPGVEIETVSVREYACRSQPRPFFTLCT